MAAPGVTFWAKKSDLDRLFRGERLSYLVGSYDGYRNYGDVLQLASTLRRVRTAVPRAIAVPLLHYPMQADHEELVRRHPAVFGDIFPLYYSLPEDRTRPEDADLKRRQVHTLTAAPTGYAQLTVYGGGYFNARWGVKKLDLIEAVEQWLSSVSPPTAQRAIVVGQQVSPDFLESGGGSRLGHFLERADAVGLRDEESLRALAARYGQPVAEKLFLSGDDAVPLLIEKRGDGVTASGEGRPFTVNVHLNLEDYVTDNPTRHLGAVLAILRQIDQTCQGRTVVNLVTAYEDSRISESRYLDRLRTELGGGDSRFRSVNCLDDWAEGFPALRGGDLTIASSYHVTLTSLILSIPTVLLQSNAYYKQKARGLQNVFNLPDELIVDVGVAREDALAAMASRLVEDAGFRASLREAAVLGTARIAIRSAETTAVLARFWAEGYQTELTGKYQVCSDKLVQAMQQLSDLQFEYERLLNATKRAGVGQGSRKAGDYAGLVTRIRRAVDLVLPTGAKILVVSRGGEELLKLGEREGWHFPQNKDGIYAGHHPRDSEAAIGHLEELQARGAGYLLLPSAAFWWLDHYADFKKHLEDNHFEVFRQEDACAVYALNPSAKAEAVGHRIRSLTEELGRFREAASLAGGEPRQVLVSLNGGGEASNG